MTPPLTLPFFPLFVSLPMLVREAILQGGGSGSGVGVGGSSDGNSTASVPPSSHPSDSSDTDSLHLPFLIAGVFIMVCNFF